MLPSAPIFISLLLPLCSATSLLISLNPSQHLPNPQSLPPSTSATLLSSSPLSPAYTAPLTTRSTLEFHNLSLPALDPSSRSYLLLISSLTHTFAPYRVDLIPGAPASVDTPTNPASVVPATIAGIWETYPGSAWEDRGLILGGKAAQDGGANADTADEAEQVVHIEAKVTGVRDFYEEPQGFNPLGLLMNPMLLLAMAAMGLTFGMPYLIDNLDPDLKAEFEDQKKRSPLTGMHSALQNAAAGGSGDVSSVAAGFDLASWMAGSGSKSSAAAEGGSASGAEVKEGRGGVRKRG